MSGTETFRNQCSELEDYPGDTPEVHIKNSIHQLLIEIMHEEANGDILTLRIRDIPLVTKHVNEVDDVLKGIAVKNLLELKYVTRASGLLLCEKVGVKI